MEKEIKILVCAHREAALPPHKYFYPIQVGAALTKPGSTMRKTIPVTTFLTRIPIFVS